MKLFFGTIPEALAAIDTSEKSRPFAHIRSAKQIKKKPSQIRPRTKYRRYDDGIVALKTAPFNTYLKKRESNPPQSWVSGLVSLVRNSGSKEMRQLAKDAEKWYLEAIRLLLSDPKENDEEGDFFKIYLRECHREIYNDVDISDPLKLKTSKWAKSVSKPGQKYDLSQIGIPNLKESFLLFKELDKILDGHGEDLVGTHDNGNSHNNNNNNNSTNNNDYDSNNHKYIDNNINKNKSNGNVKNKHITTNDNHNNNKNKNQTNNHLKNAKTRTSGPTSAAVVAANQRKVSTRQERVLAKLMIEIFLLRLVDLSAILTVSKIVVESSSSSLHHLTAQQPQAQQSTAIAGKPKRKRGKKKAESPTTTATTITTTTTTTSHDGSRPGASTTSSTPQQHKTRNIMVIYAGSDHLRSVIDFYKERGFHQEGLPNNGFVGKFYSDDWKDEDSRALIFPHYLHDPKVLFPVPEKVSATR
eukprot:Awhi_evm1s3571